MHAADGSPHISHPRGSPAAGRRIGVLLGLELERIECDRRGHHDHQPTVAAGDDWADHPLRPCGQAPRPAADTGRGRVLERCHDRELRLLLGPPPGDRDGARRARRRHLRPVRGAHPDPVHRPRRRAQLRRLLDQPRAGVQRRSARLDLGRAGRALGHRRLGSEGDRPDHQAGRPRPGGAHRLVPDCRHHGIVAGRRAGVRRPRIRSHLRQHQGAQDRDRRRQGGGGRSPPPTRICTGPAAVAAVATSASSPRSRCPPTRSRIRPTDSSTSPGRRPMLPFRRGSGWRLTQAPTCI